jgi:hypothetical protein
MSNIATCFFKSLLSLLCFTSFLSAENNVDKQNVFYVHSSIVLSQPELTANAITRNEFPGFYEDFLVLHSLIRKYQPKNIFEIGTCLGTGTMIIKNALGSGTVYSLDLPPGIPKEYAFLNKITTGERCTLPYIQIFGDSLTYDYTQQYPIDSWFIDGEHDYTHAFHESTQALVANPSTCFWHDTDIPDIFRAVLDTFGQSEDYNVYRVVDTRISYAIKKSLDK